MWSDNNPNHLPITVIIETKKDVPQENKESKESTISGEKTTQKGKNKSTAKKGTSTKPKKKQIEDDKK